MRLTEGMRDSFVKQVMDDVPSQDYDEQRRQLVQADAIAQLPPKIRAIYKDPALCDFITQRNVNIEGHYISVPGYDYHISNEIAAECRKLEKLDEGQDTQRGELRAKLRGVASSVTTTAALLTALPEFEKYIPKDPAAAIRTLPVLANVVTDFVKAGWPKDRKPPKRAADRVSA